jgi:hypothetical protein
LLLGGLVEGHAMEIACYHLFNKEEKRTKRRGLSCMFLRREARIMN